MRRQTGIVQFVDVGCRVFSTSREREVAGDVVPVGGLVVAVIEKFDQESGEIDRAFLVFDDQQTRPFIRWSTLREADVDRGLIEAVEVAVLAKGWRRLAEDVCCSAPHKLRKGPPTPGEVRATRAMLELQALVFGRDGELWGEIEPPTRGAASPPPPSHPPAPGSVFVD